jgi:ActR/RegA family two-component response regulator
MSFDLVINQLSPEEIVKMRALKKRAEELLDHTPRFKFFTLHGKAHLESLFRILHIFIQNGFTLTNEELLILAASVCVHDLGMVVKLRDKDLLYVLDGRSQSTDPSVLENAIRDLHHELLDGYLQQDLGFLTGLGFSPQEISDIRIVSKCHRRLDLHSQHGRLKKLGALLRIVDELDLSPERAPFAVFLNLVDEMDSTATWHWFKHNIVLPWEMGNTVHSKSLNGRRELAFDLVVRPSRKDGIKYWSTQISRPIIKALYDDGVAAILRAEWSIVVSLSSNNEASGVNNLGEKWIELEEKALAESANVVLIVDDEFRKIETSFVPLMDDYAVVSAPTAKAALEQMRARRVDFAIIDLQIGSGGIWDSEETGDYKFTGVRLIKEIRSLGRKIGVGILSGSKYNLSEVDDLDIDFFIRKPGDPDDIKNAIDEYFQRP